MEALRQRLLRFGLAAASALVLFAAGEPLAWGPLAWVALVPLFVAVLQEDRWRWAWLDGLVFGLVFFGVELSWIFLFGWMAWTALVVALALYTSGATLAAGMLRRTKWAPLWVAGAWTGVELVRDRWPVGGYPWGSLGTTQGSVPGVRWLAGTVGVYGLGFLAAFVAGVIARRVVDAGSSLRSWRPVAVVGLVLVAFAAVDLLAYGTPPAGRRLRMAVVQGGVPRPPRPDQRDAILASHIRLTRRLIEREGPVDVVVWPEDSIGIGVSPGAMQLVQGLAVELRTPFLVGRSVDTRPAARFRNQVHHVDARGKVARTYQKRHPVPFGEYVPIPFFRRFVGTLNSEIPYDQEPGRRATVFDVEGTKIATPICFESVFPRDFLDFARPGWSAATPSEGAEVFVLSTNNVSFERSYAAQQHLAHTRMRALELRQWVVQDALAGISARIAPDGTMSHTTRLFEATAFAAEVRARKAHSLYARTGDLFGAIWAALTLIALVGSLARPKRNGLRY